MNNICAQRQSYGWTPSPAKPLNTPGTHFNSYKQFSCGTISLLALRPPSRRNCLSHFLVRSSTISIFSAVLFCIDGQGRAPNAHVIFWSPSALNDSNLKLHCSAIVYLMGYKCMATDGPSRHFVLDLPIFLAMGRSREGKRTQEREGNCPQKTIGALMQTNQ